MKADKDLSKTFFDAAGGGIEIKPISCGSLEEKWRELLEELGLTEVSGLMPEWVRQGQEYWDNDQYHILDEDDEDEDDEDEEEEEGA